MKFVASRNRQNVDQRDSKNEKKGKAKLGGNARYYTKADLTLGTGLKKTAKVA